MINSLYSLLRKNPTLQQEVNAFFKKRNRFVKINTFNWLFTCWKDSNTHQHPSVTNGSKHKRYWILKYWKGSDTNSVNFNRFLKRYWLILLWCFNSAWKKRPESIRTRQCLLVYQHNSLFKIVNDTIVEKSLNLLLLLFIVKLMWPCIWYLHLHELKTDHEQTCANMSQCLSSTRQNRLVLVLQLIYTRFYI